MGWIGAGNGRIIKMKETVSLTAFNRFIGKYDLLS
jgi:hypothetical protein